MMLKRIEFNYYIGLERPHWEFEAAVIREASRLVGGCTVTHANGYWVEGAEVPQARYTDALCEETCFHLQFSVEPHRLMEINYTMREFIRSVANKHDLNINWVHVTTTEVQAHHFQVILGENDA